MRGARVFQCKEPFMSKIGSLIFHVHIFHSYNVNIFPEYCKSLLKVVGDSSVNRNKQEFSIEEPIMSKNDHFMQIH